MGSTESRQCDPAQQLKDAFEERLQIKSCSRYLLQNRTPKWLRIVDPDFGEILLSPLGSRVMDGSRLVPFGPLLRLPRQRHQLRVREYCDGRERSWTSRWLAGLPGRLVLPALLACGVLAVHAVVTDGTLKRPLLWLALGVAAIVILATLVVANVFEARRHRTEESSDMEEGDIDFGVGGTFYDGNDTLRRTKHLFTLAAVLIIGVAFPAIAIFVATDAKDFIVVEGGLAVIEGRESRLVGRLIQVTYTAVLSVFPALLYFQFDLHRVGTIRAEWVRAIFRMDRRMETLADVNARYGDSLSEASSYSTDSARFLGGRNSPIVIATLLVALGWTLLVIPTTSFDFAGSAEASALAESAEGAAARARTADNMAEAGAARAAADEAGAEADRVLEESTGATPPSTTTEPRTGSVDSMEREAAAAAAAADRATATQARIEQPFFQLLDPTPSAAAMAFLGAYFFGIYLLLRSYFRGDLRPKMYNQITARLVTVVVLAYLINALFFDQLGSANRAVWALSFLAGVVPTTVLQRMGRLLSHTLGAIGGTTGVGNVFSTTFATPRALTQIDGVDIHDSTRLETEGITDVPSLAKGDMVSMMVKTRLPVERLIDWTDQALLIVHVDGPGDDLDLRVTELRQRGIRTASAILAAADEQLGDGADDAIDTILSTPPLTAVDGDADAGSADEAPVAPVAMPALTLPVLAAQIRREPSMRPILSWRDSQHLDIATRSTLIVRKGAVGTVEIVQEDIATDAPAVDQPSPPSPPDAAGSPAATTIEVDLRPPTGEPEPDLATVD